MTLNRLLSVSDSEDCSEQEPTLGGEGGLGVLPILSNNEPPSHCPTATLHRTAQCSSDPRLHCDFAYSEHISAHQNLILSGVQTKSKLDNLDLHVDSCEQFCWPTTVSGARECHMEGCHGDPELSSNSHTLVAEETRTSMVDWNANEASEPKQPRVSLSGVFSKLSLQTNVLPSDSSQSTLTIAEDLSKLTIASQHISLPSYNNVHVHQEIEEPQRLYVGRGINLTPVNDCTDQHQNERSHLSSTDSTAIHDDRSSSGHQGVSRITPAMTIQQDNDGDTVLHCAIIQELFNLILAIISVVPSYSVLNIVNNMKQSPLHLAVLTHQPRVVRLLVSHGARLDARDRNGNTALHLACKLSCLSCAKELTKPIRHSEVGKCCYRVPFQRIPQDPTTLNYDGQSCVHLAANSNNMELLDYMVSPHACHNINTAHGCTGRTIIHEAICTRNKQLTSNILKKMTGLGLDVNCRAFDGSTPLKTALDNQDWDSVRLLRMFGAAEDYMDTS